MADGSTIDWLDPPTVDGYGRLTIGRWGGYLIDVCPMLFGDRLVLTPETTPGYYDHGWCYPKGGAAVLAALAWDPAVEAEPVGYIKRATATLRRAGETAVRGV